jgi:hypothetical protein
VAAGVAAGRGDHIAAPAPPVHMGQPIGLDIAQAGEGQIEMPATPTGADQRPGTRQPMGGGQLADGPLAGRASTSRTSKRHPVARPMLAWGGGSTKP